MTNLLKKPIFLSLLSALLLILPWVGGGAFWIFGAFVPLFVLQKSLHDAGRKGFLWWVALTLALWIVGTCYWVSYAFWAASFIVPAVGVLSLWPAWWIYNIVWKKSKKALAYTILISLWIALEWWYAMGDVSFPWLTIGGAWAEWPWAVQWYSMTGTYAGTLWIMVANVGIYTALTKGRVVWFCAAWIALPLILSLSIYWSYQEPTERTINVAAIQPNIDPYTDKYETDGLGVVLDLAAKAPQNTELFVAPETVITNAVDLDHLGQSISVARIRDFLKNRSTNARFIIGAMSTQGNEYYNSALCIDSSTVEVYRKSKLVIGVETTPWWVEWFAGAIDMGGYIGSLGRQKERTVFEGGVGAAICYESIYGEYFAGWVSAGAELMTIITNDGWWGDTPGHRQHAAYARLRAVENRRSIVRSANTGISELIDARGNIISSLGWDKQGLLTGSLPLNSTLTPYTIWGDMVARLALYTAILSLLFFVGQRYRGALHPR